MEIKGENLRNKILERLYTLNQHGANSVTQERLLEDLRQSFGVQKNAFTDAIRTLASQNYILDEAATCRLQSSGILEAEKLLGVTTDHQKISNEREQRSLNIASLASRASVAAVIVTIFFGVTGLIKLEVPILQARPRSTEEITKSFYTCQEKHCTSENEIEEFNAGVESVNMTWYYQNILPGSTFAREWKLEDENGKTWVRYECQWPSDKPVTGHVDFMMKEPKGLPAGTWVLTIWVNGNRILEERVKIVGTGGEFDIVPGIKTDCFDTIDSRFN